jgi:hypothetical protein
LQCFIFCHTGASSKLSGLNLGGLSFLGVGSGCVGKGQVILFLKR